MNELSCQLEPGALFAGRYRIVREEGRGGMGIVLLADDEERGHPVALKLVLSSGDRYELSRRFRREFRSIQRIAHPNVVTVFDYGAFRGTSYFTMEFVRGQNLAHYLEIRRHHCADLDHLNDPRRMERLYSSLSQVLSALAELHSKKMVHRDLKPGNILVGEQGRIKLIDFGLVRRIGEEDELLTRQGAVVGTLAYMAPEQMMGSRLDSRCDLYALGVILYETLAGRRPFDGRARQRISEDPPPIRVFNPAVPPAFESVTLKLLQRDPFKRFQSAAELLATLEAVWQDRDSDPVETTEISVYKPLGVERLEHLLPQRFVGRQKEMATLGAKLDELQAGRGDMLFLAGEAGIGKSRMIEELQVSIHLRGMRSVVGTCFEWGDSPYGAWSVVLGKLVERLSRWPLEEQIEALGAEGRALADIVLSFSGTDVYPRLPHLPPLDSPEKRRYLLFAAVANLLMAAARRGHLVLVLEDLQWMTAPGADLLAHLSRRFGQVSPAEGTLTTPILILGTFRPDEMEGRPVQSLVRRFQQKGLCRVLRLERLEERQVGEFVQSMLSMPEAPARLAGRLYRESEGNPFFLEEMMKSLLDDGVLVRQKGQWHLQLDSAGKEDPSDLGTYSQLKIPASIKDIVKKRIDRLSGEDLKILGCAAVIGRKFYFDLLLDAVASGEDLLLDCMDRLLRADIVKENRSTGEEFEFCHEKVREVVIGDLTARRRLAWHRRIAMAAERLYSADVEPYLELLAQHFFLAGIEEKATEYCTLAGLSLKRGYHNDAAIIQLRRALGLLDAKTGTLSDALKGSRFDCRQALGEILLHVGENREALAEFEKLVEDLPASPTRWAQARLWRGIAQARLGNNSEALADFKEAMARFEQLREGKGAADCHREIARVIGFQDKFKEAFGHHRKALELYVDAGERLQVAELFSGLGVGFFLHGDIEKSMEYLKKALDLFERLGEVYGGAQSMMRLGICYLELDDLHRAEEHLSAALLQLQALGAQQDVLICRINQSKLHFYQARYGRAYEVGKQAVELAEEAENRYFLAQALWDLSLVVARFGAYQQAMAYLDGTQQIAKELELTSQLAGQWISKGWIDEQQGELEKARSSYQTALSRSEDAGAHSYATAAQIRSLCVGGVQASDRELLWSLLAQLRESSPVMRNLDLSLTVAEAFLDSGAEDKAALLAQEVHEAAEQGGKPEEQMRAAFVLAACKELSGQPEEAWRTCDEALDLLYQISAAIPAEHRRAFLGTPMAVRILTFALHFAEPDELSEAFLDLGVELSSTSKMASAFERTMIVQSQKDSTDPRKTTDQEQRP